MTHIDLACHACGVSMHSSNTCHEIEVCLVMYRTWWRADTAGWLVSPQLCSVLCNCAVTQVFNWDNQLPGVYVYLLSNLTSHKNATFTAPVCARSWLAWSLQSVKTQGNSRRPCAPRDPLTYKHVPGPEGTGSNSVCVFFVSSLRSLWRVALACSMGPCPLMQALKLKAPA